MAITAVQRHRTDRQRGAYPHGLGQHCCRERRHHGGATRCEFRRWEIKCMPAGTSEDFAQPVALEASGFRPHAPPQLFLLHYSSCEHETSPTSRAEMYSRGRCNQPRESPRSRRRRNQVYEWWSAPSSKKFLMSPAGNARRKGLPVLALS